MGDRPQLSARDVARILTTLGFVHRSTKGSHEQWVKGGQSGEPFRKVTLDRPKAPFSHFLVQNMARQAGVSVKRFYEVHAQQ